MTNTPRIGVIHTSPATVDLFGRLLRERVPGASVINILDDSILPELRDNGGDLAAVEPRWRDYARIVSARGVDVVLNACSSIGTLCERVQPDIPQPIVRVDALMAREAVARGARIGVLATLATTLAPTRDLIVDTALALGRTASVNAVLVEGAYQALLGGEQGRHDELVAAALARSLGENDAVVLAQASMARVLPRIAPEARDKVLTSPPFAVEDVARWLLLV
jgi:Asp/Glu/hydantoin racemase